MSRRRKALEMATKMSLLMLVIVIAAVLMTLAGEVYAADRALWVWSMADDIVLDRPAGSRAEFFSFCDAPKGDAAKAIKVIYLSGNTPGKDLLSSYPDDLRGFLAAAHSRGLKVECLQGDKSWATPTRSTPDGFVGRIKGEERCDAILAFNKEGTSDAERFDGIHYDVEPYLLRYTQGDPYDWDVNNAAIWLEYLTLLQNCQAKVDTYNATYTDIKFGGAIPWWYDIDDKPGTPYEIQSRINYVSLMAYRETAQNIIDGSGIEISNGNTLGKKVFIGVETAQARPPDPETITFYEEGNDYMEQELSTVAATFGGNASYGGIAIHYYEDTGAGESGYRSLTDSTFPGYHPMLEVLFPNGDEGIEFTPGTTYGITWKAIDKDNRPEELQIDIYYSSNGGTNWTPITSNVANGSDGTGSYAWDTTGLPTGSQYRIRLIAKDPGGLTGYDVSDYNFSFSTTVSPIPNWTVPVNTGVNGVRPIVIPNGNVLHIVWYWPGWGGLPQGVYYKKSADRGGSWGSTITLAEDNSAEPRKPAMAVRGNTIAVVWVEGAGEYGAQKVKVRISTDGGDNWGNAEEVQGDYSNYKWADFPDIAIDTSNNVHVVWGARRISAPGWWGFHYNSKVGGAWAGREIVYGSPYYIATPAITTDGNGVHVVWGEFNWGSGWRYIIRYKRKSGAAWDDPTGSVIIAQASATNDLWTKYFPDIYSDDFNKLHVVWQTAGDNPQTDGPPITSDIYYSSSTNVGGSWSSAVYIGDGYVPALGFTPNDLRVIYYKPSATTELGDIVYRKSVDAGANWLTEDVITTDARMPYWHADVPVIVGVPSIAADSLGNTVTAWRGYSNERIMFSYKGAYSAPTNVFANLVPNRSNSLKLIWKRPVDYTPNFYSLYRSQNGQPFGLVASRIYNVRHIDTGLSGNSYYRYKVTATEGITESEASRASNALYLEAETEANFLIIDYFEEAARIRYEGPFGNGLTYLLYDKTLPGNEPVNVKEGNKSLRLSYTYPGAGWGAILIGTFLPSRLDISPYKRVKFWMKGFARGNGDVNGDGFVTPADVLMVISHLNGVTLLSTDQAIRADTTKDSLITPMDALGIINYLNKQGQNPPPIPVGPGPEIRLQLRESGGINGDEAYQSPVVAISPTGAEYEFKFSDFTRESVLSGTGDNRLNTEAVGAYAIVFYGAGGSPPPSFTYYVDEIKVVPDPAANFLIDYFEGYEDITYSKAGTSGLTWSYDASTRQQGNQSMRLNYTYVGPPTDPTKWGAVLTGTFPTPIDISGYDIVKFWAKSSINAATSIAVQFREAVRPEGWETWTSPPIATTTSWQQYERYLSDFTRTDRQEGKEGNNIFDRKAIDSYQIFFSSTTPDGTYWVDRVELVKAPPVITAEPSSVNFGTVTGSISNRRFVSSPINVKHSGFDPPWTVRLWTDNSPGNGPEPEKAGLRGQTDTSIYLPLKVWCVNYGPSGSVRPDGTVIVPDEENNYFWGGYDFNRNGIKGGRIVDGVYIVELIIDGEYKEADYDFDINGDGDKLDTITPTQFSPLSEEPFWLRIPERDEMVHSDKWTWRRLAWNDGLGNDAGLGGGFNIYLGIDVSAKKNQQYQTTMLTVEYINE